MSVKTATFNGRKYKIDLSGPLDGWCDQYTMNENHRNLIIMAKPYTQNELITIIHEALHASNWGKTEKPVDRISKEIGRLLWRLGYRRMRQ